jgi:hypothetical protein
MPQKDLGAPPADGYAPVADRITLFYDRYPTGRIITRLVDRTERGVVFRAAVYRNPDERRPAATGWASEREGDGEINTVACLENAETSAIGRALANLGFTASSRRPSYEEMVKVSRERARRELPGAARDLISLIRAAERVGWPRADGERLRAYAAREQWPVAERQIIEQRLREFVQDRMKALQAPSAFDAPEAANG